MAVCDRDRGGHHAGGVAGRMIKKPERQTISFTDDEWEEFVYGQIGFEIISNEIHDRTRWSVVYEVIIKRLEDDTYWAGVYERGATENQDYDFDASWGHHSGKAVLTQVFPREKMVTVYE